MTERPTWTWLDDAACTRHPYVDFTIEVTERVTAADVAETREAAANICASCPVRNWCATDAETRRADPFETARPFGVHAGRFYDGTRNRPTDPLLHTRIPALLATGLCDSLIGERLGYTANQIRHQRQKLGLPGATTNRRNPVRDVFQHGTRSGYLCHKRRGETPCGACMDGRRAYEAGRRDARRQNAA